MYLTIIIRRKISDEAQGEALFEAVKTKMIDNPDVTISGSINLTLPKTAES